MATCQVELADLEATGLLAAAVAAEARPGDMIGLMGPLGAGKTALARALISAEAGTAGEAPPREVPSPTFALVQPYAFGGRRISHFDLYRLNGPEDCRELGLDDALDGGIALVEWPDRLGLQKPVDRLGISLRFGDREAARVAVLAGHGSWADRLGLITARLPDSVAVAG